MTPVEVTLLKGESELENSEPRKSQKSERYSLVWAFDMSSDGLSKYISYEQWNVSYEIERGDIEVLCISEDGKMTYTDEYGAEPDPE